MLNGANESGSQEHNRRVTVSISAGFAAARGDIIVTIDADLQNDPADIPRLLDQIDAGFDVVSGWRRQRRDSFLKRTLPSKIANLLISGITGVRLHDYACSLKAYRAEVLSNIKLYGELHRFIPALASWMGVQITELPVNHSPRPFGYSKYNITRTLKVILDAITVKFLIGYSTSPMGLFGLLGALCLLIGGALGAYLTMLKLFFGEPLSDRPLLLLAVLLLVLGVQFVSMGLIGELIVRTYYEVQGKPIYVVRESLAARNCADSSDGTHKAISSFPVRAALDDLSACELDLVPTILNWMGADIPPDYEGRVIAEPINSVD